MYKFINKLVILNFLIFSKTKCITDRVNILKQTIFDNINKGCKIKFLLYVFNPTSNYLGFLLRIAYFK